LSCALVIAFALTFYVYHIKKQSNCAAEIEGEDEDYISANYLSSTMIASAHNL
jgi:hypothetical protein